MVKALTKVEPQQDQMLKHSRRKTTEQIIQGMERQVASPEWKMLKESNNVH